MSNEFSWTASTAASRLSDAEQRINNNDPALKHIFIETFFNDAKSQLNDLAKCADSPLCGAMVSVKDLFDVKGYVTKAGTQFMANDPPATADAPPIKQLRDAGAVLLGHTNMTELAFSGLGLNPHYGTPENAIVPGCIPGGSTSGGAVSVARGIADIAIGTDTGGSLRIPAAFNGIVGFKPSQNTVSREGCKPLSVSLDSVGPMARSVSACEIAYKIMSNGLGNSGLSVRPEFIIPSNFGMDDLQAPVQEAFDQAVNILRLQGYKIEYRALETLETLKSFPVWHFASVESRGEYDDAYQHQKHIIDKRISGPTRMGRADDIDAVSYRKTLNQRQQLIEQFHAEIGSRIMLMPTVPILPPSFASMDDDDEYTRINLQVLRNTTVGNIMDCCSISLPYTYAEATIGVMLTACAGHDLSLLDFSKTAESVFVTV